MRIGIVTAIATLCVLGVANAQAPGGSAPAPAAAPAGPPPTTFVVKFKIKAGRNADFEKAMAKVQAALVTSEPGNVYYDLYVPSANSQTYILIEHYKNADAVTAHGKDPAVHQMSTEISDLLDGPRAESMSADRLILVSSKP